METLGYLHLCLLHECDTDFQTISPRYKTGIAATFLVLSSVVAMTNSGVAVHRSTYRPCYEESSFVPVPSPPSALQQGSQGDRVREIQIQLKNWGFPIFPSQEFDQEVKGSVFGAQTEEAVKEFQGYVGLEPDGIVGSQTLEALFTSRSISFESLNPQLIGVTLMLGDTGDSVSELQRVLYRLGWNLERDRIFGKQTQAAVREFQMLQPYDKSLQPDGIYSAKTESVLAKVCQEEDTGCTYVSYGGATAWRQKMKAKYKG